MGYMVETSMLGLHETPETLKPASGTHGACLGALGLEKSVEGAPIHPSMWGSELRDLI